MRKQSSIVLILIGLLFLAGCGGSSPSVQEFSVVTFGILGQITAGPDGNLWFTEPGLSQIGRITPTGQITTFPVPARDSHPVAITAGQDGNLWFTDTIENERAQIGRITPAGQVTEFPVPQVDGSLGALLLARMATCGSPPSVNRWGTRLGASPLPGRSPSSLCQCRITRSAASQMQLPLGPLAISGSP